MFAAHQEDVVVALRAYFRVGAPGSKTVARFEELLAALDADQPGGAIEWEALFLEDKEFSQGRQLCSWSVYAHTSTRRGRGVCRGRAEPVSGGAVGVFQGRGGSTVRGTCGHCITCMQLQPRGTQATEYAEACTMDQLVVALRACDPEISAQNAQRVAQAAFPANASNSTVTVCHMKASATA